MRLLSSHSRAEPSLALDTAAVKSRKSRRLLWSRRTCRQRTRGHTRVHGKYNLGDVEMRDVEMRDVEMRDVEMRVVAKRA
jgi:hypothetical protein